jgi:hypothetical protein
MGQQLDTAVIQEVRRRDWDRLYLRGGVELRRESPAVQQGRHGLHRLEKKWGAATLYKPTNLM